MTPDAVREAAERRRRYKAGELHGRVKWEYESLQMQHDLATLADAYLAVPTPAPAGTAEAPIDCMCGHPWSIHAGTEPRPCREFLCACNAYTEQPITRMSRTIDAQAAELAALGNLLAVIFGDGGHRQAEIGNTVKACQEASDRVIGQREAAGNQAAELATVKADRDALLRAIK